MSNVFRTLMVPAAVGELAVKIVDALGYPDKGMFTAKVADGPEPADGQHDAYNIGDRVSFEGKNYESLIAANVWSPSVYPAGWKAI